jgi:hypothetical protein
MIGSGTAFGGFIMSLLEFHVLLSFAEMAAGVAVVYGLLTGRAYGGWTVLFFVTTILTDVTGFPLAPFGFDPPRAVGVTSLILLALALLAYYGFRLAGLWRPVYVVTVIMAFYLDIFVGVFQAFLKIPALHALAPTQSEPPFLVAQIVTLAIFALLGFLSLRKFHPAPAAGR